MIRICFHGAESTGKSVLAEKLAHELGCPWVPEYGRTYCEERGTDLDMGDLLAIAEGQKAAEQAAISVMGSGQPKLLLLDTDQLMTAAWAQMLFGEVPPALMMARGSLARGRCAAALPRWPKTCCCARRCPSAAYREPGPSVRLWPAPQSARLSTHSNTSDQIIVVILHSAIACSGLIGNSGWE